MPDPNGERPAPDATGGPISVLLVDDDPTVLEAQALQLERDGFRVATAGGPEAALDRLRQSAFDVAVTDLVMPHPERQGNDEETGLWLLQRIKASPEWAGTEVIILTGYGGAPSAAQDAEFLKAVRIHARRASALAHLAELTAAEVAGGPTLAPGPCTWAGIVEGVSGTLEALAENNGAVLEVAPPCAAEVDADVEALQNCLSYLAADVREGLPHSNLTLDSKCEAGHLVVTLTDDGDPIPADRPEPAGLPAVKAIIAAHRGEIAYQPGAPDAPLNRFVIRLPLQQADPRKASGTPALEPV